MTDDGKSLTEAGARTFVIVVATTVASCGIGLKYSLGIGLITWGVIMAILVLLSDYIGPKEEK